MRAPDSGGSIELGIMSPCAFPQTPLSGTIPPQLGELDALETLDLGANNLTGESFRSTVSSALK